MIVHQDLTYWIIMEVYTMQIQGKYHLTHYKLIGKFRCPGQV